MNTVCITGNITRDVEQRSTRGGTSVQNFCVAVNERVKNQQTGEWESRANYVDCVAFGKDGVAPYLIKGQLIEVQGRLKWSKWTTQNGETRSKLEVLADRVELLGPRKTGAQNGSQSVVRPMTGVVTAEPIPNLYDADIPF